MFLKVNRAISKKLRREFDTMICRIAIDELVVILDEFPGVVIRSADKFPINIFVTNRLFIKEGLLLSILEEFWRFEFGHKYKCNNVIFDLHLKSDWKLNARTNLIPTFLEI